MKWVEVLNRSRGGAPVVRARWCDSYLCRLRGMTFRKELPGGTGLLLVEGVESRLSTAIHMFAVLLELGVVWLNSDRQVVDVVVARPWRLYWPDRPARFILEGSPDMLESLAVGDEMEFVDAPPEASTPR